mgnify:CR=1 FL=1
MKIAFFTENSYAGGLDSFLISLINYWPHPQDELLLICNASHPGLEIISRRLIRSCRIVPHSIPLLWRLMDRLRHIPVLRLFRKILSPLLRYPFFCIYLISTGWILWREAPDRVLVVNGGYPGGDTNRAATISWSLIATERPNAAHVIHSMAVATRWWERIFETLIDTLLTRSAITFIGVSHACVNSLQNRPIIRDHGRSRVIYNGIADQAKVESDHDTLRRSLGIPLKASLCLMLGTYEPHKGHDFLFRAFKRVLKKVPDAFLVCCGYGYPQDMEKVRRLLRISGVEERVRLEGFRIDVPDLMNASDILVLPSQSFESFGLTIVEAMAMKVPVVATNVGGIPEVLGNDECGFSVSPEDEVGFADAVAKLLVDDGLRIRMGANGYERYRRLFTAQRMADEYARIIHADGDLPSLV